MKASFFLSLLFLTVVSSVFIERVQAAHPDSHTPSKVDLDKEILKYQMDALLCAASPLVARIPGSSHILEASKCALAAGLGVTEIVRSLTECAHMRHAGGKVNERDFLGCLKSGSSYFASNKEALACLLGSGLDKSAKKMLQHLGIVGDIITCSLTVAQGATLLVDTTRAANAARAEARKSAELLARLASSLKGSRIYNMGYYRGCLSVTKHFPNDEDRCLSQCHNDKQYGMGVLGSSLNREQQAYTFEACKFGCKLTEAVPNSWIYTMLVSSEPGQTRRGCEAVVDKVRNSIEGMAQVNFRTLPLPGTDSGSQSERTGSYLAWRIRINAALDAIQRNWDSLRPQRGFVTTENLLAYANGNDDDSKLISSVFGNRDLGVFSYGRIEVPTLAAYLDSTQNSVVDGLISQSDVAAFRSEINGYYFGEPTR